MNMRPLSLKHLLFGACLALLTLAPGPARAMDGFTPLVGQWRTETVAGAAVLVVDGSRHKVSATEHFPIAVHAGTQDFREGTITVRFQPVSGIEDQAGGIFFDRKANGDYLVVRANALENNLNLYRYDSGRRRAIKEVGNAPASSGSWHELKIIITGTSLQGYLDGSLLLTHTLDRPVSGGVGLWSKDDSLTRFKDFQVSASKP